MKCTNCGGTMTSTRITHRYTESGLSDVTLGNVEVRTCAKCGEREVAIPKVEQLHRLMARSVATMPGPLDAEKVRFLRKWLGLSTADFAATMGVRPETVSRWESKAAGYPISSSADRLLRLLVMNQEPVERYPIELFRTPPKGKPVPLRFQGPDWKRAA